MIALSYQDGRLQNNLKNDYYLEFSSFLLFREMNSLVNGRILDPKQGLMTNQHSPLRSSNSVRAAQYVFHAKQA